MNQMKILAVTMAALVTIGGLSACTGTDMNQRSQTGVDEQGRPIDQNFGKSYVKEVPPSEVKRQENEMTSDEIRDKGPAVGSQTPNPDETRTEEQNQPMETP